MSRPSPIPPTCFFTNPTDTHYYRRDQRDEHGVTDARAFAERWGLTNLPAVRRLALGDQTMHHSWRAVPQEKCHICHPGLPNRVGFEIVSLKEREEIHARAQEELNEKVLKGLEDRFPVLREEGERELFLSRVAHLLPGMQRYMERDPELEED